VDDHLMEISHVIRGEEWLPSLPLHVLLYRAFGWTETMPQFAHLPLLLKPDGKGKLSKRDGDRLGFPVFPLAWKDPETGEFSSGYRESGYLPEAFVNMLALLGWNPGTEQEIFSMSELIEAFNMSKISKAGAKFSVDKAKWFNQHYIKNCADSVLADYFKPILAQHQVDVCDDYLLKVVPHVKERVVLIPDFWEQAAFFFQTPMEYNPNSIKKHWKEDTAAMLAGVKSVLESVSEADFSTHNTEERVKQYISDNALNMGKVLNPLRLVLTGTGGGPHLFDIVSVIGKVETLKRIDLGLEKIV
jgi:glutamyl-tRNA synthetase